MLNRALALSTADTSRTAGFSDVTANDWFAGEIGSAARAGLIDGYEDGSFQPNRMMSRTEAAAMAVRAAGFAGIPTRLKGDEADVWLRPFADANDVPWAREVLASAVKEGLLAGSAPGELQPSKSITRAEAAAIVHRMLVRAGFISAP
jgi:hypothetical protein